MQSAKNDMKKTRKIYRITLIKAKLLVLKISVIKIFFSLPKVWIEKATTKNFWRKVKIYETKFQVRI